MQNQQKSNYFQHSFSGKSEKIKSVLASDCGLYLGIATHHETGSSFYLFSLSEQKIVHTHLGNSGQNGLILRYVNSDCLLLQNFSSTKNPDQSDLFLYQWEVDQPVFERINSRIIEIGKGWIKIPHPYFTGKTVGIDLTSGQETEPINTSINTAKSSKNTYPSSYTESSKYFSWFVKFFTKLQITPLQQVEYLKTPNMIVIGYYQNTKNTKPLTLSHHLSILDTKGNVMDTFLLGDALSAIGNETFFILDSQLIFITNYNTLNIYEI